MYAPPPPRPKKTSIIRSRSGCLPCKKQKRKCDETRPICRRCQKRGIICAGYGPLPVRFIPVLSSIPSKEQSGSSEPLKSTIVRNSTTSPHDGSGSSISNSLSDFQPRTPVNLDQLWPALYSDDDLEGFLDSWERPWSPLPAVPPSVEAMHTPQELTTHSTDGHDRDSDRRALPSVPSSPSTRPSPRATPSNRREDNMYHDADGDLCDRLYTAHLRVHLLDLLPENMKELVILAEDVSSPVHDAFLALSSANLSYLESKHEGTILEYPATLEVVRNPLHTLRAAAYFQRASKKIRLDEYTDLESLAATIGLLGYYELELGSVQSFQWHLCAFNDIIRQHEETFSCSPIGTASLQMWITLYVRSLTFVFPTRLYPEDPDAALLHKIAYKHATPYQALSMVVADAANVSHRLLLVSCMRLGFEDTRTVLQKVVTWYSTMRSPLSMEPCRPVQDPLGDDQICLVLSELRSCLAKLNINTTILSSLPKLGPASSSSEGHPAEVETTHSEDIPIKSLGITPLTFHTHDETMLHALHATAQLACEESHIEYMRSKKRSYTPPLSPWLRLLLCIAEGIITAPQTASACLLKNVYAPQGIASLVLQAALKCPWHIGALTYLSQRFFPQLQAASGNPSGGPPPATREESNIPLALYARIMRYLRFEALRGREVFIVAFDQDQTVDTGSTFALLHRPLVLTVHGRSAGPNGGFFNDCVRVGVVDS